jgi:hypothetical protein
MDGGRILSEVLSMDRLLRVMGILAVWGQLSGRVGTAAPGCPAERSSAAPAIRSIERWRQP